MRIGLLLTAIVSSLAVSVSPAGAALSCAEGGECVLGDIGPGGGVVFFVKGPGDFAAQRGFVDESFDCVE